MGVCGSKEGSEGDDEEFVYDTAQMAWDEHGNLRYGISPTILHDDQMRAIMRIDHVDEEEGGTWYLMDSAWIASWLAFAYFDKDVAPAPGPCRNNRLIEWDYASSNWVGRWGLVMAVKERAGDYRRVSKAVWEQFVEFYPGSGPAITMEFAATDLNESGFYDTSKWIVLDPPPPPEDKKKKKKKGFFGKKTKEDTAATTKDTATDTSRTGTQLSGDSPKSSNISSLLGITKNEPKLNYQKINNQSMDAPTTDKTSLLAPVDVEDHDAQRDSKDEVAPKDSSSRRESFFEGVYFGKD